VFNTLKKVLKILGPGIITGASDDDPSGIATYSQAGAQFGSGQLWTAIYLLPLLSGVQEACARVGVVTGKGVVMKSMWKVYRTQGVYLSALILLLSFSLATLVSCSQPSPAYVSLNLGIPAAALNAPVKGPLPDSTVLYVGITFKIDPKVLAEAGQQPSPPCWQALKKVSNHHMMASVEGNMYMRTALYATGREPRYRS